MVFIILVFAISLTLACSLTEFIPQQGNPEIDTTKVALEFMATNLASAQTPQVDPTKLVLELKATESAAKETQAAIDKQQLDLQATQAAMDATQQAMAGPTQEPAQQGTPTDETVDMEEKIKNAKILVYEDTQDIGMWITDALDAMDVQYVHVGDASGRFMENLNSPIAWDLIIVGAESRTKIQGEFWDVINEKITKDKTALIAEVWYLERLGGGRIRNVMSTCGIQFQADWPLAESIYWTQPDHPIFSAPNTAMPLIHYSRYWTVSAGDLVRLSPGSNATIVAGAFQKQKSDYGLITVCLDGRMVFQTFSNHDFHHDEVIALWQNYVTYTLTNHFEAIAE